MIPMNARHLLVVLPVVMCAPITVLSDENLAGMVNTHFHDDHAKEFGSWALPYPERVQPREIYDSIESSDPLSFRTIQARKARHAERRLEL